MTTIAFSHRLGRLASDTQATSSGVAMGCVTKITKVKPTLLVGGAGTAPLLWRFRDWVVRGCNGHWPDLHYSEGNETYSASGIIFMPDKVVSFTSMGMETFWGQDFTTGSGWEFARAALAMGATPERAVELASQFDLHTGGDIHVLEFG